MSRRLKQQAWEADTQWIREQFSGKRQYEDFYRGKGVWNEPATDTMTGPIGQAWKSLRGHWLVKPTPVGCGPRKWNANEEKVEPKFETQRYPFVFCALTGGMLFTKEDEEKAMSYLLGRYSDFVDRRGGSVWQDGYEHYRSNGVLLESHVAAMLEEEREKAELPTSVGQEEDP